MDRVNYYRILHIHDIGMWTANLNDNFKKGNDKTGINMQPYS